MAEKNVIIGRIGEIALKGLNRITFEQKLAKNMRHAMKNSGSFKVSWSQSRFFVEGQDETFDIEDAVMSLSKVFGLVSISPAYSMRSDFEEIKNTAIAMVRDKLSSMRASRSDGKFTFKVETKRGLKSFPMNSREISAELGGILLEAFPCLKVDVNTPDFIVYVEVREQSYVYTDIVKAQGGMPTGKREDGPQVATIQAAAIRAAAVPAEAIPAEATPVEAARAAFPKRSAAAGLLPGAGSACGKRNGSGLPCWRRWPCWLLWWR